MLPPSGLSTVAVVADPTPVLPSTAEHLVDGDESRRLWRRPRRVAPAARRVRSSTVSGETGKPALPGRDPGE